MAALEPGESSTHHPAMVDFGPHQPRPRHDSASAIKLYRGCPWKCKCEGQHSMDGVVLCSRNQKALAPPPPGYIWNGRPGRPGPSWVCLVKPMPAGAARRSNLHVKLGPSRTELFS